MLNRGTYKQHRKKGGIMRLPFMMACDFETEVAKKSEFKNLAPHFAEYDDDVEIVNPICHISMFQDKNGNNRFCTTQTWLEWFNINKNWLPTTWLLYHNLKFDFGIIVWELILNGIPQVIEDGGKLEYHGEYLSLETWETSEHEMCFVIIGESIPNLNAVQVYFKREENIRCLTLIDTMKVYNSSLANYAKTMGVTLKGSYNFKTHVVGTNHELIIEYCRNDVQSLYEAHRKMLTKLGDYALTASAITFKKYKFQMLKDWLLEHTDFKNIEEPEAIKLWMKEQEIKLDDIFRTTFPIISESASLLSKYGYLGGYTYLNPKYIDKELENVYSYDVCSMYPTVMCYDKLPYGQPEQITKDEQLDENYYYDLCVNISYETKPGFHPFQRVHRNAVVSSIYNIPANEQQYRRIEFPNKWRGCLAINSIDLQTLKEQSKIYYLEIIDGYKYKTSTELFRSYIEPLFTLKNEMSKNKDDAGKTAIKVLLNGLYGKFGQNLSGENRIYNIDEKGLINEKIVVVDKEGIYMPIASAVTAYSRRRLIHGIRQIKKNNFIYCDTDSIYCIKETLPQWMLGKDKLGVWELDNIYNKGKFLIPKRYILSKDYILTIKCAGLPSMAYSQIHSFDDFVFGKVFDITKGRQIVGGTKIEHIEYTLEVV